MDIQKQPKTAAQLRAFNGAVNLDPNDIQLSDQTTRQVRLFLAEHLATDLVFTAAVAVGSESVEVDSPTVVPLQGNFICVKEGVRFEQVEILTVTAGEGTLYTLTLALPTAVAFTTSASICLQNCNLNQDCSSTEKEFYITPNGLDENVEWDITNMSVVMYHSVTAGDDGKFGNLAALTKGVYFHYSNSEGLNLFNAKENADFRIAGGSITYSTRSGGLGAYGTAAHIYFAGSENCGVAIRLTPESHLSAHVRDDLSDLDYFRVRVHGHVTNN